MKTLYNLLGPCPTGWTESDNKCLKVTCDAGSQGAAALACEATSGGGSLARIDNAATNDLVTQLAMTAANADASSLWLARTWISGSDELTEGRVVNIVPRYTGYIPSCIHLNYKYMYTV